MKVLLPTTVCLVLGMLMLFNSSLEVKSGASEWQYFDGAKARIVQSHTTIRKYSQQSVFLALEIKLKKNWKTYWRIPGFSGLVPEFHLDETYNVRQIDVLWPAPLVEESSIGTDYVFKNEILIPIHLLPKNSLDAIYGDLQIVMGFCESICIPRKMSFKFLIARGNKDLTTKYIRAIKEAHKQSVQKVPYASVIKDIRTDSSKKKIYIKFHEDVKNSRHSVIIYRNAKFSLPQASNKKMDTLIYDFIAPLKGAELYVLGAGTYQMVDMYMQK